MEGEIIMSLRWGILSLVLLFNSWMVYREWSFRRLRTQLTELSGDPESTLEAVSDPSRMDPVTGLHTLQLRRALAWERGCLSWKFRNAAERLY